MCRTSYGGEGGTNYPRIVNRRVGCGCVTTTHNESRELQDLERASERQALFVATGLFISGTDILRIPNRLMFTPEGTTERRAHA